MEVLQLYSASLLHEQILEGLPCKIITILARIALRWA